MTKLQVVNEMIENNPYIIGKVNLGKRVNSDTKCLQCIECDEIFTWTTIKKFYLLNSHGWGFCQNCFKKLK